MRTIKLGIVSRSFVIYDKSDNLFLGSKVFVEYVEELTNYFNVNLISPVTTQKDKKRIVALPSNLNVYKLYSISEAKFEKIFSYFLSVVKAIKPINKCDIILLMMPSPPSFACFIISKILRKKTIAYLGNSWDEVLSIKYERKRIDKAISKSGAFFEAVVMNSSDVRIVTDYKLKKKYDKEPILITKPITTFGLYDIAYRKDILQSNKIKVLFIGSVIKRKGLDYAIKAINEMVDQGYEIEFHIVGEITDYQYKSYLDELIKNKENFIFYDYIGDKEELKDICKKCDIFLLPSLEEGFPRVIYEVMTQGLPVITTNVGGISHLLTHEKNALIINPGSTDDIVDSLAFLFNNRELKEKIISNNYKLISNILNDKAGKQLYGIVKRLL